METLVMVRPSLELAELMGSQVKVQEEDMVVLGGLEMVLFSHKQRMMNQLEALIMVVQEAFIIP
jgi:hypothetical protein